MMERRFTTEHDTQIEERDNTQRITGIASVFYDGTPNTEYILWQRSSGKAVERIMPTAFDRALAEKDDVRALFNHDPNFLLGRTSAGTLTLSKEAKGLRYRVNFDHTDPDHQKVVAKIRRGDLTGSSFGFTVDGEEWRKEDGTEVRYITSVRLLDVSPVVFPAYGSTTVGVRSADDATEAERSFARYQTEKRREIARSLTT